MEYGALVELLLASSCAMQQPASSTHACQVNQVMCSVLLQSRLAAGMQPPRGCPETGLRPKKRARPPDSNGGASDAAAAAATPADLQETKQLHEELNDDELQAILAASLLSPTSPAAATLAVLALLQIEVPSISIVEEAFLDCLCDN